jgi:phosphate/sulfate permease
MIEYKDVFKTVKVYLFSSFSPFRARELTIMRQLIAFLFSALTVGATLITNDTKGIPSSFEYIIGGGTAGLAVANRLSVNHTVLVVERGTDQRDNEVWTRS